MTIDEAIKMYKKIANTDANCPRYCMRPCEDCVKEHKQVAQWLEELTMLRLDSCMIHMPERLQLVENGYNKAIDDFVKALLSNQVVDKSVVRRFAEQLKEGGGVDAGSI